MKLNAITSAVVVGGLLGAGAAGAFTLPGWLHPGATRVSDSAPMQQAQNAPAPIPMIQAQGQVPDYRAIFKSAAPAVVGIIVEGMHKTTGEEQGLPPNIQNDPFFQFFRGMPGFQFHGGQQPSVPFRGQGSGFIISSDGLILTNAHVVREAKEVTVKLNDRREFTAKVLGFDPTTDIAVLRIPAKGLPTVRLGDPRNLQVGDPVMAIGTPYGFDQTATSGIVSAKGRSLPGDAVVPFIQTDAAVNPGNSGGPLFDGTGAVVGINSQIYSQTGGFQGLSFSIPINVALQVERQILATGHATHARLGVTVQDLNQGLAESFGMKSPDGALVSSIAPDSAAASAGLKPGDVITEVNGQAVQRSGMLSNLIGMSAPGDHVKLKVWRDKSWRDVDVKLGNASSDVASADQVGDSAQGARLGLALRPLTADERKQAHLESGLLVEDVGGPAADAGVQPGDVLLAINGQPVRSVEQVQNVLKTKPKNVALLIERDGNKIFVPINLG
ncbi:MAG: Do family serine endopeptidase [Burkholderiales bacterium]|nr:Do family serine endopeptidase [Burkholderiales bacterium]